MNQPYATLTLASALREMFGVQLYKNNARALLSRILSILNLDWLQHARSIRGVYESMMIYSNDNFFHNSPVIFPIFIFFFIIELYELIANDYVVPKDNHAPKNKIIWYYLPRLEKENSQYCVNMKLYINDKIVPILSFSLLGCTPVWTHNWQPGSLRRQPYPTKQNHLEVLTKIREREQSVLCKYEDSCWWWNNSSIVHFPRRYFSNICRGCLLNV